MKKRLVALDIIKGFSIIYITFGHFGMWLGSEEWESLWRTIVLFMDWAAPSLFIVASAIGTMISIKKKQASGKIEGIVKNAFIKFIFFFIVGEILNIVIEAYNPNKVGPWHLIYWNVITAIGMQQFVIHGLIKLRKSHLLLLLSTLIVIYPFLLNYCVNNMGYNISEEMFPITYEDLKRFPVAVYFVVFQMAAMSPLISWVILTIATILFFDEFTNYYVKSIKSRKDPERIRKYLGHLARKMIITGIFGIYFILLFGGLYLDRGLEVNRGTYIQWHNGDIYNWWPFEGHPLIWHRHTPHALLYNLCMFAVLFGIIILTTEVKRKKVRFQKYLVPLGQLTFTLFLVTHILKLIPYRWNFPIVMLITIPSLIIMAYLAYIWVEKARMIGSIEWLYVIYSGIINGIINKKKREKKHI
ncbi:MAG: hypothetical protein ACFFCS_16530 [Candidatus Hodarchaeota archaeon]